MYLLSIDLSDPITVVILALVVLTAQCAVLYYIIKSAATAAAERSYQQTLIQNQLLAEGLKAQGISEQRIQAITQPQEAPQSAPARSRDAEVANSL